jgi:hypothetical protein
VNQLGNSGSLVASHPGNGNAVKHGAYSPGLIQERAAEIEAGFVEEFAFSPSQRVAVHELARLMATLDAIDRGLDERGIVNRKGEATSLLNYRIRISRQLKNWLGKVSGTIDRQSATVGADPASEEDFRRELERIALGHDPEATPRDRVLAYRELPKSAPRHPSVAAVSIRVVQGDDGENTIEYVHDEDLVEA